MELKTEYATKTEIYQKIKKPLLERQRRARINKCLDGLKQLMIDLNGDSKILRMDKAEMLEHTIGFLKTKTKQQQQQQQQQIPMDCFRNGYMNAVNEVSRVLASTPGMTVEMGKSVMTHLGKSYNRLQQQYTHNQQCQQQQGQQQQQTASQQMQPLTVECPMSPASSGYHSDDNSTPVNSPAVAIIKSQQVWRPW